MIFFLFLTHSHGAAAKKKKQIMIEFYNATWNGKVDCLLVYFHPQ